ncbi:hypothetical protein [uncultured Algoriphagus sp.]|uniref:hypothetical protein n=1 Tax=uncultured Algoriphagus sp. TaxID=417365 RepID=UPI0030EEA7C3|tara:strand:- start:9595 stop:10452 length:858 start_codon:yes stop_codon:yes gene_type:complete
MILNKTITPTIGEVSVKSYQCSSFKSFLLGIKAKGFLEVTNKRLLFQAAGEGRSKNDSIIHNEIPISEVVGISIYLGKPFNWLRLLIGILVSSLIISLTTVLFRALFEFLYDSPKILQTILWGLFIGAMYLAYLNRDRDRELELASNKNEIKDNSLKELAILSLGLGMLGVIITSTTGYFNQLGSAKFATVVFVIVLIYALFRFSKKPAFSLSVFSKSGSNAIVEIATPSPLPFQNTKAGATASKALVGRPDKDSLLVLQELGAVILDIQNMGEHGIEKWKKSKI